MISPARIAALRQLLTMAAPGPWQHYFHSGCHISDIVGSVDLKGRRAGVLPKVAEILDAHNGELIVAAVNSLPELLDGAERIAAMDDETQLEIAERHATEAEKREYELSAQLAESKAKEATEVIYDLEDARKTNAALTSACAMVSAERDAAQKECQSLKRAASDAMIHEATTAKKLNAALAELARVAAERDAAITKANNRELQRQELVHLRAIALANCQRLRAAGVKILEAWIDFDWQSCGADPEPLEAALEAMKQALAQLDKADGP